MLSRKLMQSFSSFHTTFYSICLFENVRHLSHLSLATTPLLGEDFPSMTLDFMETEICYPNLLPTSFSTCGFYGVVAILNKQFGGKEVKMKFFKRCFKKKKPELKPGEILDQVISQSSATANKCLLYKLANFKGGLYDFYLGQPEVLLFFIDCKYIECSAFLCRVYRDFSISFKIMKVHALGFRYVHCREANLEMSPCLPGIDFWDKWCPICQVLGLASAYASL